MIILDLVLLGIIILIAFNGLRRGWLKAFFGLFWTYVVFIITSLLYGRVALSIQAILDTQSVFTEIICFSVIFSLLYAILRILNYALTSILSSIDAKGKSSKTIGAILGAMEGALIASIVIMNVGFYPDQTPLKNAVSYRVMKDVAPEIADFSINLIPFVDKPQSTPAPNTGKL